MERDTVDFELESRIKWWSKEIETRDEDSCSKTIEVDSSMPSPYGLCETGKSAITIDAGVSYKDTDLEGGKRAIAEAVEMARRRMCSGTLPISKVGERFRDGEQSCYTPQYVPIGPYNLRCSSPRIEKEKLCCVGFLQSLSEKQTEGGLVSLAEKLEPLVRACYADGVGHMTPEDLSRMLLRDGCYLLTCMVDYLKTNDRKLEDDSTAQTGDAQDGGSSADNTVVRDIVFLIENQIPFFVLQKIHERVTGDSTSSVLERIAAYVQEVLQVQLYISKEQRPAPMPTPPSHLLYLVHAYFQPTSAPLAMEENAARQPRPRTGRWRRATEYRSNANVLFKRPLFKDDDKWSILDVCLQGRTLWIPRLRVDSNTWTILRNLMALEEGMARRPVTAYCVFMSQVACTEEDVKLLAHSGIVEHFLASDQQVAQGFADLCKGVAIDVDNIDRNYLKLVWHDLHERCERRAMGWFCNYKHFGITIVLLVAVIVIACEMTQTFYAVTRGGQQPNN